MDGVARVFPEMAAEPPAGYVAFVAAHLDPLRRRAEQVSADPLDAERLSTQVLTDVAARWTWLELARTRLGRADAAERCLERSIGRHTAPPEPEPRRPVEFEVWVGEAPRLVRTRTNAAVRLAQQAPSLFTVAFGPLVEAAIAWQHAYAAARRRRLTGRLALLFLVLVAVVRLRYRLSGGGVE
jgi:hypothetical protein